MRHRRSWKPICQRFGLTVLGIARLFKEQRGLCALCGRSEAESTPFVFDHDHATGELRGLLCAPCNTGIAAVDRVGVHAVESYLIQPPARERTP